MPRESIKITVKISNIDIGMDYPLRPVDQYRTICRMADGHYFFDRIYQTEYIGDLSNTDKPRTARKHLPEFIQYEMTVVIHRQNPKNSPLAFTQHLPRNYIRMMLSFRHYNLITTAHKSLSETESDKID